MPPIKVTDEVFIMGRSMMQYGDTWSTLLLRLMTQEQPPAVPIITVSDLTPEPVPAVELQSLNEKPKKPESIDKQIKRMNEEAGYLKFRKVKYPGDPDTIEEIITPEAAEAKRIKRREAERLAYEEHCRTYGTPHS